MAEKKLKIRPIGPNILVLPEKAETTTKSGVVLVQKEEERPQMGEVVALGEGTTLQNGQVVRYPFTVKVGDKIYFKKYGSVNEIELDGEKFLMMTEMDVLGVVTE